jgi:hypothetical protein
MNFKVAILSLLAERPEKRVSLEELRRRVETMIAAGDQPWQVADFPTIDNVDIFESGLVSRNHNGLQITDAGFAFLRSLESASGTYPDTFSMPPMQPVKMIDDLIGTQHRLRIFDLGPRGVDIEVDDGAVLHRDQQGHDHADGLAALDRSEAGPQAGAQDSVALTDIEPAYGHPDRLGSKPDEDLDPHRPHDTVVPTAPAFLRRGFGSKQQGAGGTTTLRSRIDALAATSRRRISELWRRHFAQTDGDPIARRAIRPGAGSAAFALLSLLVVVGCVGAAIALIQIKTLRSEVATLHRELSVLGERLAKTEQAEKTKPEPARQGGAEAKSDTDRNRPGAADAGASQPALNLSREEVQLIRDYIKVTPPSPGAASPAVNVGDPVSGGTIALPSAVTDKIPRLLGARFATRDGAIIISLKNSHRADAVLGAN